MIALAFYLRVIVLMYSRPEQEQEAEQTPRAIPAPLAVVLAICLIVTLQMGILPAFSLDWAQQALFVSAR